MVVKESAFALEEIPKCLSSPEFAFLAGSGRARRWLFEGESNFADVGRRDVDVLFFSRLRNLFDGKNLLDHRSTIEATLAHRSH